MVLGFVVGFATGVSLERWRRRKDASAGPRLPADASHVIDLLRRAHDGVMACVVIAACGRRLAMSGQRLATAPPG